MKYHFSWTLFQEKSEIFFYFTSCDTTVVKLLYGHLSLDLATETVVLNKSADFILFYLSIYLSIIYSPSSLYCKIRNSVAFSRFNLKKIFFNHLVVFFLLYM